MNLTVSGIVLKVSQSGDSDRFCTILTDTPRIPRRQLSLSMAATSCFAGGIIILSMNRSTRNYTPDCVRTYSGCR